MADLNIIENKIYLKLKKGLYIIKKHPILIYNMTTALGFLLVFLYFIKIRYLPSLQLEEIVLLSLVSSLVGASVFFLLLIYLIMPSLLYNSVRTKELENIFYFKDKKKETLKYDLVTIFLPFALFITTFFIESTTGYFKNKLGVFWTLVWIALQFIIPSIIWFIINKKRHLDKYIGYVLITVISEFTLFASLFIYFSFLNKLENSDVKYLLLIFIIGTLLFFIITFTIKKTILKLFFNVSILILIIITTNSYYLIPYRIMEMFNLGQIPIKQMYIEKKGCLIINKTDSSNCEINDLMLLWRLGETFVIEKQINDTKNYNRYYIPKKYVLSWSREIEKMDK